LTIVLFGTTQSVIYALRFEYASCYLLRVTAINVSNKVLAALDRVRSQRGIRTRAKALEVIAFEAAPEHPLEQKTREAKTVRPTKLEVDHARRYLSRQEAGQVTTFSAVDALKRASKLRASK
jgi:hypothetical protein